MEVLKYKFVKMLDITYITIIFVTIAIAFSIFVDRMHGEFNPEEIKKKSTIRIIMEIYLNFAIIAIFGYVIRNIIEFIPSPFDGLCGVNHLKVKELNGGLVFGFTLFYYQTNLRKKIDYVINERLFKKN